MDTSGEYIGFP